MINVKKGLFRIVLIGAILSGIHEDGYAQWIKSVSNTTSNILSVATSTAN